MGGCESKHEKRRLEKESENVDVVDGRVEGRWGEGGGGGGVRLGALSKRRTLKLQNEKLFNGLVLRHSPRTPG